MRLPWHGPALLTAAGLVCGLAWFAAEAPAGGKKGDGGLKVKEGEAAPDVELPATQPGTVLPDKKDAKTLRLRDLKGKKNVVLYFYPKALTGG
jgi:hypothetical protein